MQYPEQTVLGRVTVGPACRRRCLPSASSHSSVPDRDLLKSNMMPNEHKSFPESRCYSVRLLLLSCKRKVSPHSLKKTPVPPICHKVWQIINIGRTEKSQQTHPWGGCASSVIISCAALPWAVKECVSSVCKWGMVSGTMQGNNLPGIVLASVSGWAGIMLLPVT